MRPALSSHECGKLCSTACAGLVPSKYHSIWHRVETQNGSDEENAAARVNEQQQHTKACIG